MIGSLKDRPLLTPKTPIGDDMDNELFMRYLGCLKLLSDCSIHAPEDLRERIQRAMEDACLKHSSLETYRDGNHISIEPTK